MSKKIQSYWCCSQVQTLEYSNYDKRVSWKQSSDVQWFPWFSTNTRITTHALSYFLFDLSIIFIIQPSIIHSQRININSIFSFMKRIFDFKTRGIYIKLKENMNTLQIMKNKWSWMNWLQNLSIISTYQFHHFSNDNFQ